MVSTNTVAASTATDTVTTAAATITIAVIAVAVAVATFTQPRRNLVACISSSSVRIGLRPTRTANCLSRYFCWYELGEASITLPVASA